MKTKNFFKANNEVKVSIPLILQDFHLQNSSFVDKFYTDFLSMAHVGGLFHYIKDERTTTHSKECTITSKCDRNEFMVKFDEKSNYYLIYFVLIFCSAAYCGKLLNKLDPQPIREHRQLCSMEGLTVLTPQDQNQNIKLRSTDSLSNCKTIYVIIMF